MLLVAGFLPRRPGFEPGWSHVGFIVDEMALGHVFSQYFGFRSQWFHWLLHTHHHHHHHHPSSGTGTVGQIVDSASPHTKKRNNRIEPVSCRNLVPDICRIGGRRASELTVSFYRQTMLYLWYQTAVSKCLDYVKCTRESCRKDIFEL
jgi:hypothetical protein